MAKWQNQTGQQQIRKHNYDNIFLTTHPFSITFIIDLSGAKGARGISFKFKDNRQSLPVAGPYIHR